MAGRLQKYSIESESTSYSAVTCIFHKPDGMIDKIYNNVLQFCLQPLPRAETVHFAKIRNVL